MRILLLPVLLLGASAATPAKNEIKVTRMLAGLTPGAPVECLTTLPRTTGPEALGSRLVYRVSRNLVYVNETGGGCEGIARGDALITQTPSTRQCRGDIARTVDLPAGIDTGTCVLGTFVPYTPLASGS